MSNDNESQRPPYTDWMREEGKVRALKEGIKKSGVPLEARTRQVFNRAGLPAGRHHYYDSDGHDVTLREIDLQGEWSTLNADLATNREVGILANILVECKYSSSKDWFVFKASEGRRAWFNAGSYPPSLNGQWLLWQDLGGESGSPSSARSILSRLPVLSEQIVEADAWSPMTRKDGNYSTRTVHTACAQLHSAAMNSLGVHQLLLPSRYKEVAAAIGLTAQWQHFLRVKWPNLGWPIPGFVVEEFLNESFRQSDIRPMEAGEFLYVAMVVPLIVIDDTRGLILVELDSEGEVSSFTDVGYCLYLHVPERKYSRNNLQSAANAFPVLIANLSQVDQLLELVKDIMWELHSLANQRVEVDK